MSTPLIPAFGAHVRPEGGVDFSLWAPGADHVALVLRIDGDGDRLIRADRDPHGWYRIFDPVAAHGTRYRWRINQAIDVPDPASRFNPDGVHGYSQVIDPARSPREPGPPWTGRPWHEAVIYELHVGTFTPEGTFAAAQTRLPELAALGITAVQLMPLADFPGRFGWGYDGVLPFAPHPAYGTPDDLKRFIDTAHAHHLMVLLDVVYNHFGPEGNYLPLYAPSFFSTTHHTAWGAAINFDGADSNTVREFYIQNALYWVQEFGFDGLRFDAVHAMIDRSSPDIMETLSLRVRQACRGRHVHLVLENDSNDPRRLDSPGSPGRFDGQWSGDLHHALHVLMTGESEGYYAEYVDDTLGQLRRALTHGFTWEGGPHNTEGAAPRRRSSATLPLGAMVNFLQNHDQVGNRAFGERLTELVDEAPLRLATALLLLNPTVPLLMMGEEHGATTPFLYFSDWQGSLRKAVTEGRRREFAQFSRFSDPAVRDRIPDPCASQTFLQSKLDWDAARHPRASRWHALYAELLRVRRESFTPHLPRLSLGAHDSSVVAGRAILVHWRFEDDGVLSACLNLGDAPLTLPERPDTVHPDARCLFTMGDITAAQWPAWSGRWWWQRPSIPAT